MIKNEKEIITFYGKIERVRFIVRDKNRFWGYLQKNEYMLKKLKQALEMAYEEKGKPVSITYMKAKKMQFIVDTNETHRRIYVQIPDLDSWE